MGDSQATHILVGGPNPDHPESESDRCDECGAQVWLSPASLARRSSAEVRCLRCYEQQQEPGDTNIVTRETLAELADTWGCSIDQAFTICARMVPNIIRGE
jgi:hypothetical protein